MTIDLGRVTPIYRGVYESAVNYELNDIVLYTDGNIYWHTQETATSGVPPTVAATWALAFSGADVQIAIQRYANAASASADAAAESEENAGRSATAAATSETNASASASAAASSAVEAGTSEENAGRSATAAAASAAQASEAAATISTTTYAALAAYAQDTASGAVASFPDGADNIPVAALTVDIDPVQSGSGTPSPSNVRPITGFTGVTINRAGKNLLPYKTLAEMQASNTAGTWSDGAYTLNGVIFTPIYEAGSLVGVRANGTASADATLVIYGQSSSGSWNLAFPFEVLASSGVVGSSATYRAIMWGSINRFIDGSDVSIPAGSVIYGYGCRVISGATVNDLVYYPMIRPASDADATFMPYNGATYPVDWTDEAGTAYSGTLDAKTGVLTVDKAMVTLTAANISSAMAYRAGYAAAWTPGGALPYTPKGTTTAISNILECKNVYGVSTEGFELDVSSRSVGIRISFADIPGYTDPGDYSNSVDAIKSVLTTTPMQVLFELDAPLVYQLDPVVSVNTLSGQNNIWADTGDVDVTYRADTALYVARKIAEAGA